MRKLLTFLTFTISFAMMSTVFAGSSGDSGGSSSSSLTPEQEVQICKQHLTDYPGGSYQFQSTDKSAGSPESCELDYQPNVTIYDQGDGVSYPPSSIPTSEPTISEGPSKPPRRLTPESWEELERQDFCAQNPSQCRESTTTEDVTISPIESPIETDTTAETDQSDNPTNDDSEFSFRPECPVAIDSSIPGCRNQNEDTEEVTSNTIPDRQSVEDQVDTPPTELGINNNDDDEEDEELTEVENRNPIQSSREVSNACSAAQQNFEDTQKDMYSIPLDNNPAYKNLGDLEYARANTLKQIALLSALRQINGQYHQYLNELESINQRLDRNYDDFIRDTNSLMDEHGPSVTRAKFYDDVLDILQIDKNNDGLPDINSPAEIKTYCSQPNLYQKCHLINKLESDHILLEVTSTIQDDLTRGSISKNVNHFRQALTQGLPNGVFDRQHLALQEMQVSLNSNDEQALKTAVQNASSRITSYEGNAKSVLSNLDYEFKHNQNLENYFKSHTSPDLGRATSSVAQQDPYPQNAKDILKNHFAGLAPNCEACQDDSLFDIFKKDREGNFKLDPEKARHFLSSLNDYIHQEGDDDDQNILDDKISELKSKLSYLTQEITKIHHKPAYLESLQLNQLAYQQMITHCGDQVGKSEGLNPVSCNQDVGGVIDGSIEEIIRFGRDSIRGVIIDPSKKLETLRNLNRQNDELLPPSHITDSSSEQENDSDLDNNNSETGVLPPTETEVETEVTRSPTNSHQQDDPPASSSYQSSREARYLRHSCNNGVWKGSGDSIRLEGCTKYNHWIPTATRFGINTIPVLTSTNHLNSHLTLQRLYGYNSKEQTAYYEHQNAVWGGNQFNQWNQNLLTSQFANPFGFSNPASMSQYGLIGASMMPGMVMPMTSGLGMMNSGFLNTSLFIR